MNCWRPYCGRRIGTSIAPTTGLQGLACVETRPYDLVLTDVRMPGMDGLELLRRIREIRPETKVMVMTADSTPANIVRAIRERAFAYFSKPFSPIAVADTIAQAVNTGQWQDDIEVLSAVRNGSDCGCAARWKPPTG